MYTWTILNHAWAVSYLYEISWFITTVTLEFVNIKQSDSSLRPKDLYTQRRITTIPISFSLLSPPPPKKKARIKQQKHKPTTPQHAENIQSCHSLEWKACSVTGTAGLGKGWGDVDTSLCQFSPGKGQGWCEHFPLSIFPRERAEVMWTLPYVNVPQGKGRGDVNTFLCQFPQGKGRGDVDTSHYQCSPGKGLGEHFPVNFPQGKGRGDVDTSLCQCSQGKGRGDVDTSLCQCSPGKGWGDVNTFLCQCSPGKGSGW